MTRIHLDSLTKRFGPQVAVDDVTIDIPSGAFTVLLGPSGCGKTTTLRMLAGLEDATSGTIRFDERVVVDGDRGVTVPAARRGLGMVFQSYALWPHMTARQNVAWPLQVNGWSRSAREDRVAEVLRSLEIEELADRTPAEMSGGQQQRVAIARTIAPGPDVVLFDEPLSNLDARLRVETRAELGRLHRESGATSVYVTHDQVEALALATHIAVMKDGRLEQFGTPQELLERPATEFVAAFLGSPPAVLLPGRPESGSLTFGGVPIAPLPAGADVRSAMYRPEELAIDADGTIEFDVVECTPSAGRHLVTGFAGPGDVRRDRLTVVSTTRVEPGSSTRLRLPPRPEAYFDADGNRVEVREGVSLEA
ncbi:ABC transporter ATP-binding protein [Georgenia alba]|uniref:ABC transporter ATP-binding protein n=1 Tax=Georgenia alba TaxID=2233858 RepID=A0ABW2Q407_9MICO